METKVYKYFKVKLRGENCYLEVEPPTTAEHVEQSLCDLITDAVPVSEDEYRANT